MKKTRKKKIRRIVWVVKKRGKDGRAECSYYNCKKRGYPNAYLGNKSIFVCKKHLKLLRK